MILKEANSLWQITLKNSEILEKKKKNIKNIKNNLKNPEDYMYVLSRFSSE